MSNLKESNLKESNLTDSKAKDSKLPDSKIEGSKQKESKPQENKSSQIIPNPQKNPLEDYTDEYSKSCLVNFTNEILVNNLIDEHDCKIYYVPVYCRTKLKNIINLDFEKLTAKVNVDFIISVYYGGLSKKDREFLEDNMVLAFPRDDPVYLNKDTPNVKLGTNQDKSKDNCFKFTVRKIVQAEIVNDIKFAPFEQANIVISVNMRKIKRRDKVNVIEISDDRERQRQFQERERKDKANHEQNLKKISEETITNINSNSKIDIKDQDKYPNDKNQSKTTNFWNNQKRIEKQIWIKYKFNLMNVQGEEFHELKFSLGAEKQFGFYNIAEKKMEVIYSNKYENPKTMDFTNNMKKKLYKNYQQDQKKEKKKQQQQLLKNCQKDEHGKQNYELLDDECVSLFQGQFEKASHKEKIDSFQYAYFIVPMYKSPYSTALLIFSQLLLVGIVNACIFYQDLTKSGKQMINMAALMVSLISILPNIRQNMGRSSQLTLAEVCIIAQALTIILTFIHMLHTVNLLVDEFYFLGTEALIFVCIGITAAVSLVILGFLFAHVFIWRKRYHFDKRKPQATWLERKFWKNHYCDREFRESIDFHMGRLCMVKPVPPPEKKDGDSYFGKGCLPN